MNSIFITDSGINKNTGGGVVSLNMIESLRDFGGLSYILCNQKQPDNKYMDIPTYSINPVDWGYPVYSGCTPFFRDYMAFHLLPREPFDLYVTYGCPFGLTMEDAKTANTKIICDLPPHNIEISQEEHIKFTGEYEHPHLTNKTLWGLYSRHLRYADKVIVHSKISAEYIKKKANLRETPIVLPHGCYLPEKIPGYPEQIAPGYMGAIGIDKGIPYLASAWVNIAEQCKSQMILGGRDAQNFQVIDEYMKYFKKTGNLNDLADFYKQISFGVFPSVTEGFNIPALECLSYGRPVIITDTVGMADYITDGKEGFIVPIKDINAIIDKIFYFYENPNEIKRMGENARKLAEHFSWDIVKKQYIEIYRGF